MYSEIDQQVIKIKNSEINERASWTSTWIIDAMRYDKQTLVI